MLTKVGHLAFQCRNNFKLKSSNDINNVELIANKGKFTFNYR